VPRDFSRIGEALAVAAEGCTILVSPGEYKGFGNRDLEVRRPGISIIGVAGAESTVIDCSSEFGPHFGVSVRTPPWPDGSGRRCEIQGITIRGGLGSAGGALRIERGSVDIRWCAFVANEADSGGAVFASGGQVSLVGCTFHENRAGEVGGAIANRNGTIDVNYCQFEGNDSPTGSAIALLDCNARVAACRLIGNGATITSGTALWCHGAVVEISGGLVVKNEGIGDGGGIRAEGATYLTMQGLTVAENRCSGDGGGILVVGGSAVTLLRSIVAQNCAVRGSDAFVEDGGSLYTECTYLDSTGVAGTGTWQPRVGVWSGDVGFVRSSGCGTTGESDFHLRADSQCRQAPECGWLGDRNY
jgi:hypothetical protein